jgi:YVTN family beta-propeller protein
MKRVLPTEAAPPKETDMIKRMVALLVLITLIAASHPAHAQSGAGQKLYVGLFKEDAVAVLDVGERRVVRRIAVPRGPHGLVITPDGRKVYVSSDGASTVSVIDAANDRVVGSIEVGPKPHGLAVSADGRQVLVSAWGANEALVIDTATDRVTARVAVTRAHNGAFTPGRPHGVRRIPAAGRHRARRARSHPRCRAGARVAGPHAARARRQS